jgi:hypothetical protein
MILVSRLLRLKSSQLVSASDYIIEIRRIKLGSQPTAISSYLDVYSTLELEDIADEKFAVPTQRAALPCNGLAFGQCSSRPVPMY